MIIMWNMRNFRKELPGLAAFSFLQVFVCFFLTARLQTFLKEAWSVALGTKAFYFTFITLALLLTVFSPLLINYLKKYYVSHWLSAVSVVFAVIFVASCHGIVVTQCCFGHNTFFCSVGAVVFLSVFFYLLFSSAVCVMKKVFSSRPDKKDLLVGILIFAVLNLWAVVFCMSMKKIFVWDNAGYFPTVLELDEIFPSKEYFKAVYRSVFEIDYNYIIAVPASIMCKIFGKTRLAFVLGIFNFYLFPLCLMIYAVARRIFKVSRIKSICTIAALPILIFSINGFIDVGGVLPLFAAAVLFLYCKNEKAGPVIGFLLAFSVLMRRWYSFYAVAFIIVAIIYEAVNRKLKYSLEIVAFSGFTLLFFAQKLVSGRLLADYGNLYSAYALGVKYDIFLFARYFGVVLTLIVAVYAVFLQIKHIRKGMLPETFALLSGALCFAMFVGIQTHGQQHLYLYIPSFAIICISLLKALRAKLVAIAGVCFCLLQTANTFVPRVQPTAIRELTSPAIIPDFSNLPPVEMNTDQILDMMEYLDENIGEKGKTLCFLSSSIAFNTDTLRFAEISLSVDKKSDIERDAYIKPIPQVDNRDGISHELFLADYILAPSELQIHLAESDQEVISIPYRKLVASEGFGKAYEKTNVVFTMESGLEIYLYRRTREVTLAERREVTDEIYN